MLPFGFLVGASIVGGVVCFYTCQVLHSISDYFNALAERTDAEAEILDRDEIDLEENLDYLDGLVDRFNDLMSDFEDSVNTKLEGLQASKDALDAIPDPPYAPDESMTDGCKFHTAVEEPADATTSVSASTDGSGQSSQSA